MDIERLKQYGDIKKEIESLKKRIINLSSKPRKYVFDTVSASSDRRPFRKRPIIIKGRDVSCDKVIDRVAAKLNERESALSAELEAIEDFISSIHDSEMRQIIQYRYIDGFGWQKIAFEMGETDESYPRRKHKSFFQKLKLAENAEIDVI